MKRLGKASVFSNIPVLCFSEILCEITECFLQLKIGQIMHNTESRFMDNMAKNTLHQMIQHFPLFENIISKYIQTPKNKRTKFDNSSPIHTYIG